MNNFKNTDVTAIEAVVQINPIQDLKDKLEVLRTELINSGEAQGEAFNRHRKEWESINESKQKSIADIEQKLKLATLKIHGVAMSDFEMNALNHEARRLRDKIIEEKAHLARFQAEPDWQRKYEYSTEYVHCSRKAVAVINAEIDIAKLEVKTVLTDDVLKKVDALYGHFHLSHSLPINLQADLRKFLAMI